MRALIKFSALTLASAMSIGTILASEVLAGDAGVTPPDSSGVNIDGAFSPEADTNSNSSNTVTPAAVNAAVVTVLSNIASTQSVTSPTGESIPLTPAQAATITAALTATGSNVQPAIAALEQQLASELGGLGIDIAVVGATPDNLSAAIAAANTLINSLTGAQLTAALESPTFVAIRSILAGGDEKSREDGDVATGGGAAGIPILSAP